MTISSHAVSAILSRLSCSCQHLKKPFSTFLKSCFYVHKLASCSGNKPQLAYSFLFFFISKKKHHPPPQQQQQPPLKKSNKPTTTTPEELLASYRAFFAQNLRRSSSFFSVTTTTFRYTHESSDSHPASFLSLGMAMRLVGSVERCARKPPALQRFSLSSLSLFLSLSFLSRARLGGRSPGRGPTLPRVSRASSRPSVFRQSVRPSVRSVRATARRPPVRPSVRLPEPTHKSTFSVHTTNSSHLPST